jgi:hypothetical protein
MDSKLFGSTSSRGESNSISNSLARDAVIV